MKKIAKSTVVMAFCFALAGMILAGCGEAEPSGQDMQENMPQENEQQESIPEENEQQDSTPQEKEQQDSMPQENEQDSAAEDAETGTAEKTEQAPERYEDNFAVDSEAAREFAEKVKGAAAQKDLEALAELIAFPVYVGLEGVGGVETKEEFLELGAERVFTDELLESVKTADVENLQPSRAGFSISDGGTANIIFSVVDGALTVVGINY